VNRAGRWARLLPPSVKDVGKRGLAAVDPAVVAVHRARHRGEGPVPPVKLRARVGSPLIGNFLATGKDLARRLERGLAAAGRPPETISSVLDFGCGCGRVLRPLIERWPSEAAFHGCDIDDQAISWLSVNEPRGTFAVTGFSPPLPYETGQFDLVYSVSVLTHLGRRHQFDWLGELQRIVAPGGLALVSTHGEHAYRLFSSGQMVSNSRGCAQRIARHSSLTAEGFFYEPYEAAAWNATEFVENDDDYGIAFHSDEYVRTHWDRYFSVLEIIPAGLDLQDLVVLQARAGSGTPA